MTPNQRKKLDRNKKIIKDYQTGDYSLFDLAMKYRKTPQRIHQIVKAEVQN